MTPDEKTEHLAAGWIRRLAVHFASLRPHLLLPAWGCALSGAAAVFVTGGDSLPRSSWPVLLAVLGWSSALVAGHLVNLVADRHSDAANAKNLFWPGIVSKAWLRWMAGGAALLAVVLAWTAGCLSLLSPGAETGPVAAGTLTRWSSLSDLRPCLMPGLLSPISAVTLLSLVLGLAYSLPPFRLAARWGWDLTANAAGYGLLAPWFGAEVIGEALAGTTMASAAEAPAGNSLATTVFVLLPLVATAFLWTTMLDSSGDEATGKRTWAVRWGGRATLRAALSFSALAWLAAAAPLAAGDVDRLAVARMVAATLVLPPAIWLVLHPPHRVVLSRAIVLAVVAAAAPGLALWPWLAAPLAGWWFITRACHRWLEAQSAPIASH